ncbi:hypothetical protein HPB48_017358 [Haemaphysalis longicornis]|uniref:Uncharacterized protein n=1 Tax=Haemaphysalis longicornis TaxID=44386 RepID=A0A9J6G9T5_HAELO|nr:hypothetical protein HPB48_017358 [Haemaphysalis longicornis]
MSELTKLRDELRKEMREFEAKMERDLRKELRDLKASLDFFNKEFEKAKAERFELAKVNKELKASNENLAEECRALKKQASQLEDRVTTSEQYSRNRNLEIKGVPLTDDENICEIVRQIGNALEVPIEEGEIEVVTVSLSRILVHRQTLLCNSTAVPKEMQCSRKQKRCAYPPKTSVLHPTRHCTLTSTFAQHSSNSLVWLLRERKQGLAFRLGRVTVNSCQERGVVTNRAHPQCAGRGKNRINTHILLS